MPSHLKYNVANVNLANNIWSAEPVIAHNPYELFREECQTVLAAALKKTLPDQQQPAIVLKKTPNIDYGQLATSLCFELAKKLKQKPLDLAKQIAEAVDKSGFNLIEKVEPAGAGYINFYVDFPKFSALTFNSIKELDQNYGFIKTEQPKKIIVEHTSVNPLHPIHIGQARNPTIGDTLARILATKRPQRFSTLLHRRCRTPIQRGRIRIRQVGQTQTNREIRPFRRQNLHRHLLHRRNQPPQKSPRTSHRKQQRQMN